MVSLPTTHLTIYASPYIYGRFLVVESVEADAVPTGTQGAAAADTGASQQTTTSAAAVVGDSVPGTSSGATEAPSNTSGCK